MFLFPRVIKPEEGKKLADSWGAAFMESSAKENDVMLHSNSSLQCTLCLTQLHTLMTIFLRCRLLWRFSSASFWRWRKPMEMHPQRRRSVLWCKSVSRILLSSFAEDRRHNFTSLPITTSPTPRHFSGTFLLYCYTRLIYIARQLLRQLINYSTEIFLVQD